MGDLISRSSLMRRIEVQRKEWGVNYDVEQILGDIEDFITAYDMDKVVGELKKLAEIERENWNKYDDEESFGGMSAYLKAIKIVKMDGFVADDVCEWKYSSQTGNWDSDRHKKAIKDAIACDWKVCPYCAKKIKVVKLCV